MPTGNGNPGNDGKKSKRFYERHKERRTSSDDIIGELNPRSHIIETHPPVSDKERNATILELRRLSKAISPEYIGREELTSAVLRSTLQRLEPYASDGLPAVLKVKRQTAEAISFSDAERDTLTAQYLYTHYENEL